MDVKDIPAGKNLVPSLRQMVDAGKVPHAMMFHEDDGGGAFPLALSFLEYLYGSPKVARLVHPDVHFVYPVTASAKSSGDKAVSDDYASTFREFVLDNPCFFEQDLYEALGFAGKQALISVWEARSILSKLALSGVEGGWRTVVVYLPEKMNIAAANTLLKMVEEPPAQTLFLMITHAPEKVLTTISSRCLHMRIPPMDRDTAGKVHPSLFADDEAWADLFGDLMDALLRRDLLSALESADAMAAIGDREKQKSFLNFAGESLRRIFLIQQGLDPLAAVPAGSADFYSRMAKGCKKTFARQGAACLDRALTMLERNVNQKILFSDLVGKLYILM